MFSDDFILLWNNGMILKGVFETIYMTFVSTAIAYIIGLPLGILMFFTGKNGVRPIFLLNKILSVIVNILRSIPFIILMVALIPFAKLIVGKSIGNEAMIVMLVVAAFPYIARMVESSMNEINKGVIEATQSMGISNFKLITKVLIPETRPALITGAVISTVTVLGYSAMAPTIAAGGLGMLAINYGHERLNDDIIWLCIILTVIIVQIIQEVGMLIARKSDKRLKE